MPEKNASTRMSIIGRGANCRGGKSAVEQSAYISRTTIYSEYYAQTYYPKYTEDLVYTDILLPDNAPERYHDREVLWNSVEAVEKHSKAQLARLYKVSLPNAWSHDIAVRFMQDYINRNFVSKGMCAEYAVHDSVNQDGVHNLHCHILLTMRPILDNGEWGEKQKKIYKYDSQGNKLRKKNGRYDCTTVKTTDWDNRENARKWRKDLVDSINVVNEHMGNDEVWEWRSFRERGLDLKPTIHLGEQAAALERKGVHTDKGDYNRDVKTLNSLNAQLKDIETLEAQAEAEGAKEKPLPKMTTVPEEPEVVYTPVTKITNAKSDSSKPVPVQTEPAPVRNTVQTIVNEVIELIKKAVDKWGRMMVPTSKGVFTPMIRDMFDLTSSTYAEKFVNDKGIGTFAELENYYRAHKGIANDLRSRMEKLMSRRNYLKELSEAYAVFSPLHQMMDERNSLSVVARIRFDKEHRDEIDRYPDAKERFDSLREKGSKITPKAWAKDISRIEAELSSLRTEYTAEVRGLATAEVIEFTKEELQAAHQADRGQAYTRSFADLLKEKSREAARINSQRKKDVPVRNTQRRRPEEAL